MSVETDMLSISVIGPKANVTRMLNEAIRQEGAGELIVDGDDIETINRKLIGKDGKPGMMVKFAELIDEKCLEDDALLKERWQAAVESHNQKMATKDSSDGDFEMDIELAKVVEYDSDSFEVKFSEYVPEWVEDFDCIDWAGWEDIARVYKCRVFVDDDEYYNGGFWKFCGTTVYEPKKGGVSKKRFEPQLNLEEYKNVYDELIELNPERYRAKKIHDFEDKITRMQNEVYREKINTILSHSEGSDVIDVPGDIVRIPSHAFNGKGFLWASLHEGTLRIGNNAFLDCSSLILISLPSTLREIGTGAFKGCKSLEKIVLPASLESLGRDAFKGCNLKSIRVQRGNEYWYSKGNCLIDKKDATLLLGCKKSVIPEGVSTIADGAFWGCTRLKSIVIPSGVVRIGEHSFRDCTGLQRVVIPGTVACISGWSFMGCPSLKEVVIEDGVESIDIAAFANCTSLERIVIPPSVKQISAARFASGAFEGCTSLTSVDLPDGVSIDDGAFKGCPCEEEVNKK